MVGVSAVGAGERPSARRRAEVGRHRERCIVSRLPRRNDAGVFFYSGNWRASRLHLNHIRSSLATSQPAPPEMEQCTVLCGCPARGRKA